MQPKQKCSECEIYFELDQSMIVPVDICRECRDLKKKEKNKNALPDKLAIDPFFQKD